MTAKTLETHNSNEINSNQKKGSKWNQKEN